MNLGETTLTVVALAALGVAALALLVAVAFARRLTRIRRATGLKGTGAQVDVVRAVDRSLEATDSLTRTVRSLELELTELRAVLAGALQRVGVVRFDAYEDMGGKLSFAAALLDAEGSGVVLSSINGRTETRIYAKPIERGASRYNLSGEEEEAIARALSAPDAGPRAREGSARA